jgi:TonB-linked SusC/RagA family outer membrane protein
MKITTFLLFLAMTSMSASSLAQETLTVKLRNASILEVLEKIEEQTDFGIIFRVEELNLNKKYNLDESNISIFELLDEVLRNENVTYKVIENTVIIHQKQMRDSINRTQQQSKTINGTVTDHTGEPLPGVNVYEKSNPQNGVITGVDGSYNITMSSADAILVYSFIGFDDQELTAAGRSEINVTLVEQSTGLNEVVVVGYGSQKKVNLTGAISSVGSEKLESTVTSDITSGLIGKLPGLRVMQFGSEPGTYDNKVDIRGWGEMLVVIDGIPRDDFQRIDPNSIASVTILKDASAAVYGVKAANGVMLIKTKKGEKGAAKVEVNSNFGFQSITDFPLPINNSVDNLILKNEAALVAGNPIPYPDWEKYTRKDIYYPSYDYWDITTRERMPMNKNTVSISGGSEEVDYFVSFGNFHEEGLYSTKSMFYDRYNLRSNLSVQITDALKADIILSGMVDKRQTPYGSSSYDFIKQVWMQPPYEPIYANNMPPYYYDGQADRNPVAIIDADLHGYRKYYQKRFETTSSITYDVPFVKGLKVKGLFAYDLSSNRQKLWRKKYYEYKYDSTNDEYRPTGIKTTKLDNVFSETIYHQAQLSLQYTNSFFEGKHNVDALLLGERRDGDGTQFGASRDFDLAIIDQLDAGNEDKQYASGSDYVLDANLGLVGRMNYDYKSKYLFEFSFRYDASSLFPPNSRWGFFPAFSAGWRISEESFIRNNFDFIDNLKIRFSHGKMGDDSGARNFQFIEGYNYPSNFYILDGSTVTSGAAPKGGINPNITWFTATTTNIGFDATLYRGLLDLQVELFERKRDGLLGTRDKVLPTIFGSELPLENLNSDLSRGFELTLGHRNKINQFEYGISANLTYAKQEWGHYEAPMPGNSYLNWRNNVENRNKNIRWGYGYIGQFQSEEELNSYEVVQSANGYHGYFPGDIVYEDYNEDGMIDSHDSYPISRGVEPEIYYGIDISAAWKGVTLNLLFQGATNYTQIPQEQLQGPLPWGRNSSEIFLDRWHHEDPLDFSTPWVPGKYPITRDGFGFGPNKWTSPFWVKDVAYLRLKNIMLSYDLPRGIMQALPFEQVRFHVTAYNWFTWKSKDVISDPEKRLRNEGGEETSNYGYKYPLTKSVNFGVNVIF